MKQLFIYVPEDIHEELKRQSELNDIGISTCVRSILKEKFKTRTDIIIKRRMLRGGRQRHTYGRIGGDLPIRILN